MEESKGHNKNTAGNKQEMFGVSSLQCYWVVKYQYNTSTHQQEALGCVGIQGITGAWAGCLGNGMGQAVVV